MQKSRHNSHGLPWQMCVQVQVSVDGTDLSAEAPFLFVNNYLAVNATKK